MATRKEIINVQVQYKSLEGMNKALGDTRKELEKLPVGSKEFKKMAVEVRKLESALESTNNEINGLALEDKFMAANGAIKVFGGSIAASVGALGLLGVESEKLGKFQEQAASALAFGVGLKDIGEGFADMAKAAKKAELGQKAYNAATKAGQAIMKLFNITAAANPIGILIVSLTAAGALIYAFRDSILNMIKSALGPLKGIVDRIAGAFNNLMVAVGLADTEQEKMAKANIERFEEELALAQARGEDTIAIEKKILAEKRKLLKEGTKEYKENILAEKVIDEKAATDKTKADEEAAKKLAETRRVAAEKRKADKDAQDNLYLQQLQKLADEELALQAKTDEEKLKLDYDKQLREIDALKLTEDQKAQLKLEALENYNAKEQELKDKQNTENQEKEAARQQANKDAELELLALEADTLIEKRDAEVAATEVQYQRLIAEAKKNGEDTVVLEKIKAAKIKAIKEDYAQQEADIEASKRQVVEVTNDMAVDAAQQALTSIFGDNKAVASANVLVDAGQAAVGILNTSFGTGNPIAAIAFQVAQFATLAATTVSSLRQINSAKPGGGGSAQRPTVTPMNLSAPQATPDVVETPDIETQTVKAYVVQGDIRSSSEAEAKINSRRTLTT